ncbi:hypothetical protein [Haloprofundus salinisoli]|uniref:hypothetical protein n=1 Tax=Haloprofundus salinisoli TaxID=2876193 RepID=UPI001CCCA6E6|nr:hypothetical protein [Haloprofundus salinisoli]
MPALWTYPWTLFEGGIDKSLARIDDSGFDAINVASHYHSVRSLEPRNDSKLFRKRAGGCYFEPKADRFAETTIEPIQNDIEETEDPLRDIVDAASDRGLSVNAWTVCLHNTRLGAANPQYRIESAFDDAHDHAFCPSHPEVREYFAAVVASVVDCGVADIQLESVGYPSVFHSHGVEYGHDKRQVLTSPTEELLFSQCFCDGCAAAAESHTVDFDIAQTTVRELVSESLETPHSDPISLDALVQEHDDLADLFDFRADVVTEFVERLADAAGKSTLTYYDMPTPLGTAPGSGWASGIQYSALEPHLDRVTALCYVSDPAVASDLIRTFQRTTHLPVDVGLTLDPSLLSSEAELRTMVDSVRSETDGRIFVYHHSLLTDAQFGWLEDVFVDR